MAKREIETHRVSRRDFLRMLAVTGGAAVLVSCGVKPSPTTTAVPGTAVPGEEVTETPAPPDRVKVVHVTVIDPTVFDNVQAILDDKGLAIDYVLDMSVKSMGWTGFTDTIITRLAGGEQVDAFHMAIQGLTVAAMKKIIQPIDPFINSDAEAKADIESDFHPNVLKILNWQGKQYGLPNDWNNMVVHYNTKIFTDLGVPAPSLDWTWDDFRETCLAVASVTGGENDRYAYGDYLWSFFLHVWYFNNDTAAFTEDWLNSNMNDPKVAETLQFLADLILVDKTVPSFGAFDVYGQFFAQNLVMRECGGWCIGGYLENNLNTFDFQYNPHKAGNLKTVVGAAGELMTTLTKNPDATWEVIKVLALPEIMKGHMVMYGAPAGRLSLLNSPEFLEMASPATPDMGIFVRSLDFAKVDPCPPNLNITDPLLNRWYSQIFNGELSVEDGVKGAHEELQAEMDIMKTQYGLG